MQGEERWDSTGWDEGILGQMERGKGRRKKGMKKDENRKGAKERVKV